MRLLLKSGFIGLFCIISLQANAQLTDTAKKSSFIVPDTMKRLQQKGWVFIGPAALISYGALSFVVHPVRRIDYYFDDKIAETVPNFHTRAESYFEFVPVIIVYGLNLAGNEGNNRFIDRTALLGLSAGIAGLSTTILKYSTHRERPNRSDNLSFPSAHTTAAFAGAEFLAQEYGDKSPWYTIAGYTIAVGTGAFRMYNRDHWFSDVVAGAGFGILSTKAAYLVYPWLRNKLTHTDKQGRSTMLMPNYQNGIPGLNFAMSL